MVAKRDISSDVALFDALEALPGSIPCCPEEILQDVNFTGTLRDDCGERGYHRIHCKEPKNSREPMVCYDCGLFFDEMTAKLGGIEYIVEP